MYTNSEKTEKNYTIGQAVVAARIRCGEKTICVNAVCGRNDNEKITLAELNRIADEIVDDTYYHNN